MPENTQDNHKCPDYCWQRSVQTFYVCGDRFPKTISASSCYGAYIIKVLSYSMNVHLTSKCFTKFIFSQQCQNLTWCQMKSSESRRDRVVKGCRPNNGFDIDPSRRHLHTRITDFLNSCTDEVESFLLSLAVCTTNQFNTNKRVKMNEKM